MRIKTRLGNLIVEANPITEDEASKRTDLSVLSTVQIDDKIYTLGTVEPDEDDPLIDNSNEVVFLPTTEIQDQANIDHDTEEAAKIWPDLQEYIKETWKLTDLAQVSTSILLPTYKTLYPVTGAYLEFQFAVVEQTNRGTFYIKYINEPNITQMLFAFTYSAGYGIYRIPTTILPVSAGPNFYVKTSLSLGTTTGTAFDGGAGSALADDISILKGYFNNAQAKYAIKDSNGNTIHEHYQTLINKNNKISAEFIEGLPEGVYVESEISATSQHPVSSSALYDRFEQIDTDITTNVEALNRTKQSTISAQNPLYAGYLDWRETGNGIIPNTKIQGLHAVATSGNYNDLTNKPNIPEGVLVDTALSTTSENPVQNKIITDALNKKQNTLSSSNKLSASYIKDWPKATTSSLGSIIVGDHLTIDSSGKLSVDVTDINDGILDQDTADGLYVPLTRKINNKTLNQDITISKSDLGLGNVSNVSTINSVSSGSGSNITSGAVYTALQNKQDKLTAGQNIIIENGVIKSQGQLGIYGPYAPDARPEIGEIGVIYLEEAPASSAPDGDKYIEYIWVNGAWERLGSIGVNLTDYVKTDRTIANLSLTGDITASALRTQLNLPANTNTALNNKQDKLAEGSHINIDTNNKISILMDDTLKTDSTGPVENKVITAALAGKQDTITAENKLSFNLIDGGPDLSIYATTAALEEKADKQDVEDALATKQDTLESGVTLRTINGESLLGSGNLVIAGGGEGGDNNLGVKSVIEHPEGPVISAPDTLVSKIYVKQTFTEDESAQLLSSLPVLGASDNIIIRISLVFMGERIAIDPDTNEETKEELGLAIIALHTLDYSTKFIIMSTPDHIDYELQLDETTGLWSWKDSSGNLIPEYFEINDYGLDKIPEELAAEDPETALIYNIVGIGTNNYQLTPFVWTEHTDPPRLGTLTYLEEEVYPKTLLENIYITPTKPASLATTKDLDGLRLGYVTTADKVSDLETQMSNANTNITNLQTNLSSKQDKLTAGDGITITNNVISATSTGAVDAYTKTETDALIEPITTELGEVQGTLSGKQDKMMITCDTAPSTPDMLTVYNQLVAETNCEQGFVQLQGYNEGLCYVVCDMNGPTSARCSVFNFGKQTKYYFEGELSEHNLPYAFSNGTSTEPTALTDEEILSLLEVAEEELTA